MAPLLRDLAAAYQTTHPLVEIDLRAGDSKIGLSELLTDQADLAAVSWHPADDQAPPGFQDIPVGRDAIAIVVHPSLAIQGLSLVQIRAIYRGEILDWAGLGGPDAEPIVISREEGSGTRDGFESMVMAGDRVTLNALIMPTSQAVVEYVGSHRYAIGYVSSSELSTKVRALLIEESSPSAANVRSGQYHLTRLLYLFCGSPAPVAVQDFADFALSASGQAIVARQYVPLR